MSTAIRFENVSKQYRLGEVGSGTIADDLKRGWAKLRGRPDPLATIDISHSIKQHHPDPSLKNAYTWALRDVSLSIEQGDILGIIGKNGAGKSTLLKLLSRVTAPTSGIIKAKGRIASLLEVGTGFHPELTGRENIFLNGTILGMQRLEIARRLDEIIEFSGCTKYIDTPVKRYSSGMLVRLGFAVAAHLLCEILIVDEVLAVGDHDFQTKCIGKMKEVSQRGRTVIVVSHNMGSINSLCDRCVVMSGGQIAYDGSVDTAVGTYLESNLSQDNSLVPQANAECWFETIVTTDTEGVPAREFGFQQPINIRFSCKLELPIQGLELAICVTSHLGTTVFWTSRSHSMPDALVAGKHTFQVQVPPSFLCPGTYYLSLAAHIPNNRVIQHLESVSSFSVAETGSPYYQYAGQDIGVVNCQCDWKSIKIQ
ncbi:lipopolysaccharide transport system ATP-binding protein [Neorhodopirellula lusitana]|uniref:Lipopolysaccharide transport system ATP-binding protein n=1 Tax=Neorhodopirellula lusitana TaxID=445327 RepID=A0ABY1Q0Z3_9BACT|nr:ABC transporter ATP-binding protein [Neorhodopirellula lusitana]SMP55864.1 lipopolysaccharide transport system ATP-binding protein [Neorhodopirellula lusitana]